MKREIYLLLLWFLNWGLFYFSLIIGKNCECRYSSVYRMVQKLTNILKQMDPRDPYRVEMTDVLLEKL